MRTGRERLGPFPIELEMRLIHVVGPLIKQHALPGTAEIESLVSTNATWAELIAVLELKAGIGKAGAWQHMMRSAGKAVARVKRLFAKAES
jgi:hypothetical protein